MTYKTYYNMLISWAEMFTFNHFGCPVSQSSRVRLFETALTFWSENSIWSLLFCSLKWPSNKTSKPCHNLLTSTLPLIRLLTYSLSLSCGLTLNCHIHLTNKLWPLTWHTFEYLDADGGRVSLGGAAAVIAWVWGGGCLDPEPRDGSLRPRGGLHAGEEREEEKVSSVMLA